MLTRTLPFSIKSIADSGIIEGVVSAFNGVDRVGDTILPGAYSRSLKALADSGRKLPVLYQHDPSRPIGVWSELTETGDALIGRAELSLEVRDAAEAFALAKQGALTGISIGFEVPPGGSKSEAGRRTLVEIDLWEASLVTFPADPNARVTAIKSITCAADIAELLREAGYSGRKAKLAAGAAWRSLNDSCDEDAAAAILAGAMARLGNL